MEKATIPMRLPGLNQFIDACKTQKGKWNAGNQMKKDTEKEIAWFLKKLPAFQKPIRIKAIWVSTLEDRRDPDNICFAKKFILDALQECGKITNDNRKKVVSFADEFEIGANYEVRLEIEEEKCL